jgi:hypothetical protein
VEDASSSEDPDLQQESAPLNMILAAEQTIDTCSHSEISLPRDCEVLLYRDLSEVQKLEIILGFSQFNPPHTNFRQKLSMEKTAASNGNICKSISG